MRQSLLDGDPLLRVEGEAAFHKVDCSLGGVGVNGGEGSSFLERKSAEVVSRSLRIDSVVFLKRGCAKHVENERELMMICSGIIRIWVLTTGNNAQSRPGKRGRPESISPRMHPTDHMSIALVYCLNLS